MGRYLLHVRFRREALALPGSPFSLEVTPGRAHAKSTRIRGQLSDEGAPVGLRGTVGLNPENGFYIKTLS